MQGIVEMFYCNSLLDGLDPLRINLYISKEVEVLPEEGS